MEVLGTSTCFLITTQKFNYYNIYLGNTLVLKKGKILKVVF